MNTREMQQMTQRIIYVSGWLQRMLAFVMDCLLLTPIVIALSWGVGKISGIQMTSPTSFSLGNIVELMLEQQGYVVAMLLLSALVFFIYLFIFTFILGATPGMRLCRIKLINHYGDHAEWWRVGARCVLFFANIALLGLGLLWMGFDRERRGLHDLLTRTYVIRGHVRQVDVQEIANQHA